MKPGYYLSSALTSERVTGTLTETKPIRRRLGGRSALVKAAVFQSTKELLFTEGYNALSIAGVGAHSGVHETSIYRRWKSKEALVSEVCIEYAREALPMPDTGAIRSDLILLLYEILAFLESPMGEAMIQAGIATLSAPAMIVGPYWSSLLEQFSEIIEQAVERGELPSNTDTPLLLKTLIGPLCVQVFLLHQPLDETLPRRIVDLVLGEGQNRLAP